MARVIRLNGKFYDTGTSNRSFLQVAKDLCDLKIKNWYFLLEIRDYSLVKVDPYSLDEKTNHPNLTKDEIARIMLECKLNPWYYLREISRIPEQGGTSIPYKANRGNIAQAWCILHGLDSWLCLPRQQGKTQSALAIENWIYSFGTTNSQFIFINKDGPNAKQNLTRMVDQIDCLPEYLRFESYTEEDGTTTKSRRNATLIKHPITNNEVIIKSKATSYEMALSLARGLTAPILHFDEPEFTSHIKTIVSNSFSTYETASRNAKRNGAAYARIFTCTPGDLDTAMGMEAQEILDKTIKWNENIYDKTPEEIDEFIAMQGKDCNKIFYIEYQYNQIGLDNEWLEKMSAGIDDPLTVRREILLQRLHGSSMSPFPKEDIEYIVDSGSEPIEEIYINTYYRFDVYEKLDKNIPYIVGVDCSTGTGGDNNAITILNPFTLKPAADFECNFIGETNYEKLIIALVRQYIPRAIVAIERNSLGDGIIDHLLQSPIASRLYYDKDRDLVSETMKQHQDVQLSMLKNQVSSKTYYGVWTGQASRDQMMSILANHVSAHKDKFITKNIIRDLSRLVRSTSGKIVAGKGFHDDSIMSYLIALYIYYNGNNLALFGYEARTTLETVKNEGLIYEEDILREVLPEEDAKRISQSNKEFRVASEYEEMMRAVMIQSNNESAKLVQSGLISTEKFENIPKEQLYAIDDEDESDLSLFNDLNNYGPVSRNTQSLDWYGSNNQPGFSNWWEERY